MKIRFLVLFSFVLCWVLPVRAQVPGAFTYQAVARDGAGELVAGKTIGIRLSILDGSTTVYAETHVTQTNAYGMFSVNVGTGAAITGNFANITWGTGIQKALKTEIDFNGGTAYTDMGITVFTTVPYAQVANEVAGLKLSKLQDVSTATPLTNQVLQWNGTQWAPSTIAASALTTSPALSGNGTVASPLTIAQQGATNGQILQWNGTQWTPATPISGGVGDNWGSQLALTNVTLTGNGTNTSPLGLAQQGAQNGETLLWNGSLWTPGRPSISVEGALAGNGTPSVPLKLGQQGAAVGNVLRWNGTSWVPGSGITLPFYQAVTHSGSSFIVENASTNELNNAIAGHNTSNSSAGTGVFGSHNGGGIGVLGVSGTGTGVYGQSLSSSGYAAKFSGNTSVTDGLLTVNGSQVQKSSDVYLFDQSANVTIQNSTLVSIPGLDAMAFKVENSASVAAPAKVRITVNVPILSTTSAVTAGEDFQLKLLIKQGATTVKQLTVIDNIRTNSSRTLNYTMHHKITTPGNYTAVVQFQKADASATRDVNVNSGQVQIEVTH